MSNANARKGAQFERDLQSGIRQAGMRVVRVHDQGQVDEGDLLLILDSGDVVTLQAKNTKRIELGGAMREAAAQAERSGATHAAVVHKRRNHPTMKAYVTMELEDWLRLISSRPSPNQGSG